MSSFDWASFLRQWSEAILESMDESQLTLLPPEVLDSGWFGYAGATEEQICQAESRLGVKLPPSYRDFLKVTNGWRQTTSFIHRLWSTEGIERFAARHQKWIEAFSNHQDDTQLDFEAAIELEELWEPWSVPDEEYLIYGEEQDCSKVRVEYLRTAIEISDVGVDAIYLLNPQIVGEDGEWEAWFFADCLPGADRYRSFREMMEAEYQNFLEQQDTHLEPDDPPAQENTYIEFIPLEDEFAEPEEVEVWRSLKRLTIEFQTRQVEGHPEYRTIASSGTTSPPLTWARLEQHHLYQWIQQQLREEEPSDSPILPEPETDAPEPETGSSPEQPSLAVVEAPKSEPALPAKQLSDLSLEIDQLEFRQKSRPEIQIKVCSGNPNHVGWNGSYFLLSREPFSLDVKFSLVGQSLSRLLTYSVNYKARVFAQNRTTGQWITLGETNPSALLADKSSYFINLFGNAPEPGIYRLQVVTRLEGDASALKSFELPLLSVV
jgi:hypothetical protein